MQFDYLEYAFTMLLLSVAIILLLLFIFWKKQEKVIVLPGLGVQMEQMYFGRYVKRQVGSIRILFISYHVVYSERVYGRCNYS